jgi:hypothetical protein
MVDVKEAAQRASDYFADLYGEQGVLNVQLEEVELTDDGKFWLITLSYPGPREPGTFTVYPKKKYKVFKIDAKTGDVKSMKIRKVE